MVSRLNSLLDWLSNFLANRKGLLPILGILLIVLNFVLQLIPAAGWVANSNLFLHLGIILAILGFLLAWAL
jgi:hypothetical protein